MSTAGVDGQTDGGTAGRRRVQSARRSAPSAGRAAALAALRAELRRYQSALDAFDETVSGRLGLNRTDFRCFDLLEQHGVLGAGALARACGLTSGAMTFVLDRLEAAGLVVRRRDPADRRRVLAELDPDGRSRAQALHDPLVADARAAAAGFSVDELATICRFLSVFRGLYEQHTAILRGDG